MDAEQYLTKFEKDLRFKPGKDKLTVDAIIAKTKEYARLKEVNKNKKPEIIFNTHIKKELDE